MSKTAWFRSLRRNDIVVMDNCRSPSGDRHWPGFIGNSGRDTALPICRNIRPTTQSHRDALQQIQDIPCVEVAARTIPSLNRAIRSFIPQLSPRRMPTISGMQAMLFQYDRNPL